MNLEELAEIEQAIRDGAQVTPRTALRLCAFALQQSRRACDAGEQLTVAKLVLRPFAEWGRRIDERDEQNGFGPVPDGAGVPGNTVGPTMGDLRNARRVVGEP